VSFTIPNKITSMPKEVIARLFSPNFSKENRETFEIPNQDLCWHYTPNSHLKECMESAIKQDALNQDRFLNWPLNFFEKRANRIAIEKEGHKDLKRGPLPAYK
jgi:hypothetical protein